jgi:hypothetical protein
MYFAPLSFSLNKKKHTDTDKSQNKEIVKKKKQPKSKKKKKSHYSNACPSATNKSKVLCASSTQTQTPPSPSPSSSLKFPIFSLPHLLEIQWVVLSSSPPFSHSSLSLSSQVIPTNSLTLLLYHSHHQDSIFITNFPSSSLTQFLFFFVFTHRGTLCFFQVSQQVPAHDMAWLAIWRQHTSASHHRLYSRTR